MAETDSDGFFEKIVGHIEDEVRRAWVIHYFPKKFTQKDLSNPLPFKKILEKLQHEYKYYEDTVWMDPDVPTLGASI